VTGFLKIDRKPAAYIGPDRWPPLFWNIYSRKASKKKAAYGAMSRLAIIEYLFKYR